MLRTMRNKPETETELRDLILRRLTDSIPWKWEIEKTGRSGMTPGSIGTRDFGVDAWLNVRSGKVSARIAMEVRLRFEPRDVERLQQFSSMVLAPERANDRVADAARPADGCLLAAPFLGRRAQELLERAGWNYADATGNVRIALDTPPLFVKLAGESKNPFREARPLRSLKGPIAGRLVRALADFNPPCGIRELAQRARTSPAMASRVVAMLERDAIVTREGRGPVTEVDWKALIERWCEEYTFITSNRPSRYLALRGLKPLLKRLQETKLEYAVTGTLVAERRRTVASSVVSYIYTSDVPALARDLDLELAGRATNVLLVEPFDPIVFERSWIEEGIRYVALSQAVADLLSSGDRNPQVGSALMSWMEENENAWRV